MLRAAAVALVLTVATSVPVTRNVAPQLVHGSPVGQRLRVGADNQVSSNWAGYAISGTGASGAPISYTDVTGRWIQPAPVCSPGSEAYSAFWVGLGGFSADSQALEQVGTEADCTSDGKAVYTAWYEIVPAPAVPIRMKILPGDQMLATVLVKDTQVLLQITNLTRYARVTKIVTVPEPDLRSAEWIAEAPSECSRSGQCRTLPLANFGSVGFTRIAATGDGHAGTLTDATWTATPIELAERASGIDRFVPQPSSSSSGAVPSGPSTDGRSFNITWHPAAE